jgi:2',3'-cyclic-nucleotide 2'-phosphodiesterase (5'-nucleotidase family)
MKNYFTTYFTFLIIIFGLTLADFPLTILHTNDVHARFLSFNDRQRPCEKKDVQSNHCWGGAARRQTAMKKFMAEDENVIKLDAGDQFQGTIWYTALKWEPIAQYMNIMKYDAMAFGNHEFDDGLRGLEPFVRNLSTPIVNSNIEDMGSPIKDLYNRKIIKEIDGEKIGK